MLWKKFVQSETKPKGAAPNFEQEDHATPKYVHFNLQKWEDLIRFRNMNIKSFGFGNIPEIAPIQYKRYVCYYLCYSTKIWSKAVT